jgi:hypothetical protein
MGTRGLALALVVASSGCTHREVIRPGTGPSLERHESWTLETRSSGAHEVDVVNSYSNGDLMVANRGQVITVKREDIASLSRPRRGRGWLQGFAFTMGGALVLGTLGAASANNDDDCSAFCGPSGAIGLGVLIGALAGLTIGGTVGAIKGAPEIYVYE